ncbi:MAG TPA: tocopherol cyclase family protein [Fusibacter sp.]|nr:tocopherol cyclase family protein [Fusibacter sp.]
MSLKLINKPELFQGNLEKKDYFEGWYFKHVSGDCKNTIAFIPGVSLDGVDSHSFVQVIMSPDIKTYYFRYPLDAFSTTNEPFSVTIGENLFSMQGCKIALDDVTQEPMQGISIQGDINYTDITPIDSTFIMPNIMGFFAYIPNMECNHGVLSMNHQLDGHIDLIDHQMPNDYERIDFTGGKGYTEKDWGTSFPSEYIWIQANHFEDDSHSFMCSIATIPFGLFSFRGLIANLHVEGKEYRFATYNRSKVENFVMDKHRVTFDLVKRDVTLTCETSLTETGALKAPKNGEMQRTIKEGLSGKIILTLKRKGLEPLTLKSSNVSIEITL